MAESEEELKSLLMKVEESEKTGLKLNIQKTKIMASGPITSGQINGGTMETVTDFIFGGCKITADGDCSHEITQGQPKGKAEIAVVTRESRRNSSKTTWFSRHRKMRPLPALKLGSFDMWHHPRGSSRISS